jgi:hypothetical protein
MYGYRDARAVVHIVERSGPKAAAQPTLMLSGSDAGRISAQSVSGRPGPDPKVRKSSARVLDEIRSADTRGNPKQRSCSAGHTKIAVFRSNIAVNFTFGRKTAIFGSG